ncbi:unnamed protein product [Allacma fusca]|uniref:Uncharacterized protein n=1 Tax=Allacma fusca TaxID=39272 RepID=A0A8J2K0Y2_9HEXA|nr:unnamed protein product [Allacma fusca]
MSTSSLESAFPALAFIWYDELKAIDTTKIVGFVQSLQQTDGSLFGDKWTEVDITFTFCAVATLALLLPELEWTMNPDDDFGKGEPPTTVPGDIKARFDFNGSLMDPKLSSDSTWLQGLHHHGDEMDKPGCTFQDLLFSGRLVCHKKDLQFTPWQEFSKIHTKVDTICFTTG